MFDKPPKTQEEYLLQRLDRIESDLLDLLYEYRPTIPIYDKTNLPINAVEGQVAIIV